MRFPSDPNDPWYSKYQCPSDGFDIPKYHTTKVVNGAASKVKPGDTIWLVGQLYTPWGERLPPTLDARIDVQNVTPRVNDKGYLFTAASTSRWFPLANASTCLASLTTVNSASVSNKLWKVQYRSIGHFLQRLRELESDNTLREWELSLPSKSFHFISYRIPDGTNAAFDLAKYLLSKDVVVFWDRWSLPRRLAERREAVGDEPLDKTIINALNSVDVVWGIESPLYGVKNSYSKRERILAIQLGKYKPLPVKKTPSAKALRLNFSVAARCISQ